MRSAMGRASTYWNSCFAWHGRRAGQGVNEYCTYYVYHVCNILLCDVSSVWHGRTGQGVDVKAPVPVAKQVLALQELMDED